MKNNPHRASKAEIRKQTKAARKFAKRQHAKSLPPNVWATMCPKVAR